MEEKVFLWVQDVASYMDISIPTAYKVMKQLNDELASMGYIVIAGRVNRKFFESKIFGGKDA